MSDWQPSPRELERRQVRRSLATRSVLIATVLTVAVFVLVGAVVVSSPGWDTVKATFFDWQIAKDTFPDILDGFWLNVKLFMICEVCILVLGLAVALARVSRSPWLTPVRIVAVLYTDLFRGVPTVLLVLLLGFGVPALQLQGLTNDRYFWAGWPSCSRTAPTSPRSTAPASTRSTPLRSPAPRRSASVELPGVAPRRRAAGGAPGGPAAAQRLHLAAEGHRPDLGGRRLRRCPRGPDSTGYLFNYTPYVVVAVMFIVITIPLARFTDWLGRRMMRRERAGAR